MKTYLLFLFIAFNYFSFSQNDNWQLFSNENISHIEVSKSGIYQLNEIIFKIIWDNKLNYSDSQIYFKFKDEVLKELVLN